MVSAMLWVVPLQTAIFFGSGMYRGIWRYASVADLQRIALAVGLSTLVIALVLLMLPHQEPPVPRSVILLDPILLILFLGGSRLGYRVWKERRLRNVLGSPGMPVVILGAGDAAADLLKNLARAGDWRVLGLLRRQPGQARPPDSGRERPRRAGGLGRPCPATGCRARHYRHALGLAPVAPARAGNLPPRRGASPDRALVSGSDERQGHGFAGAQHRTRRPARPRPGAARRKPPASSGSAAAASWSPAPADRSARSCAGRSRASNRRSWCCTSTTNLRSTAWSRNSPSSTRNRIELRHRRRQERRARGRGARRVPPANRVPRRGLQACAADGGGQRLGGDPEQRARHLARGRRRNRSRRGEIRAHLHRQGGQPDQCDGREQAPGGNRLPGIAGQRARPASSSCASATCSAAPAA